MAYCVVRNCVVVWGKPFVNSTGVWRSCYLLPLTKQKISSNDFANTFHSSFELNLVPLWQIFPVASSVETRSAADDAPDCPPHSILKNIISERQPLMTKIAAVFIKNMAVESPRCTKPGSQTWQLFYFTCWETWGFDGVQLVWLGMQ